MIPRETMNAWAISQGIKEGDIESHFLKSRKAGQNIFQYFMSTGIVPEAVVLEFMSLHTQIPIINLKSIRFDDELLKAIPKRILEQQKIFPVGMLGKMLTVATSNPFGLNVFDDVRDVTGCEVLLVLSSPKQIKDLIDEKLSETTSQLTSFVDVDDEGIEFIQSGDDNRVLQQTSSTDEAPVVRLINSILDQALRQRASDIHLEPYEKDFRIRYRTDGSLKAAFTHAKEMYNSVVARIKIMSQLDITEKRVDLRLIIGIWV